MAKNVKISDKPNSNKIIDVKDIGKIVKYKRTLLGLTRQEVADFCNLSYITLQNIENGSEKTGLANVLKVMIRLGIELETNIIEKKSK
jgi:transcriptional regulator with XRE-family HTH domain